MLFSPAGSRAAEWYAAPGSDAGGPGTNWATAYHDIQSAVNDAGPGDRVWVSNGVYETGVIWVDSMANRIAVTNSISVESIAGPEETIIRGAGPVGAGAVRCAYLSNGAKLNGFMLSNGHSHTNGNPTALQSGGGAVLFNASISNCVVISNHAQYGGGVNLDSGAQVIDSVFIANSAREDGGAVYVDTNAVVNSCRFESNEAWKSGGAVFCDSLGNFERCSFSSNSADYGGAVNSYNSGKFSECSFWDNTAFLDGGAIYIDDAGSLESCAFTNNYSVRNAGAAFLHFGGELVDCEFIGNSAGFSGGAVSIEYAGVLNRCGLFYNDAAYAGGVNFSYGGEMNNSLLVGNYALTNGGGVYMDQDGRMLHCTLSGNTAGVDGGGVYSYIGGDVVNSVVWSNVPDNHIVGGGAWTNNCTLPSQGVGCRVSDPLLESTETGRLLAGSPCIDAGFELLSLGPDLEGVARPLDGDGDTVPLPDMGAYEFSSAESDTDGDLVSDYAEYVSDTDGTDAESWFRIVSFTTNAVSFPSSDARTYTLLFSTNLATGRWDAVDGVTDVPGSGGLMELPPTNISPVCFFRVMVSFP